MTSETVNVMDMALRREARANAQQALIETYHEPVVSFCMNIPGPVKTNELIRRAFEEGQMLLLERLAGAGLEVLEAQEIHEKTGDELLLSVAGEAEAIKEITLRIENEHPLGRLFDMDVIGTDGVKLSRERYRTCLICGRQAQDCASSRRHSAAELFAKIEEILGEYYA